MTPKEIKRAALALEVVEDIESAIQKVMKLPTVTLMFTDDDDTLIGGPTISGARAHRILAAMLQECRADLTEMGVML